MRQQLDDAGPHHDELAELGGLDSDPVVHVPQKPRGLPGEAAVPVGGLGASAAHADVAVDQEALHQPLDYLAGDQEVGAAQADRLDVGVELAKVGVDRVDLAQALGLFDETNGDPGAGGALAHDRRSLIRAAAGDDDYLDDLGPLGPLGAEGVKELADVALLVICGNSDANPHGEPRN